MSDDVRTKISVAKGIFSVLVSAVFLYWIVFRYTLQLKQTKDAFSRSESDLAEAQAIAHQGSWRMTLGTEGERWFGSAELYHIYGYPPDLQLTREINLNCTHPEDRAFVQAAWSAAMKGEGPNTWEFRIIVNEQIKWLDVKVRFIYDAGGNLTGAAGVVQDITEHKQADEELKESREQLRTVVEKSPISMALVNMRGDIEYINLKAIETFGYLPQDIPDMDSWWVQAYPDKTYRDQVITQWMGLVQEALLNKHEIEKREYRVTCKDRTVKIVIIFGVWVGERVLTVFDDITERKQFEEQSLRAQKLESIGTLAGGIAHDFNNLLHGVFGYISLAKMTITDKEKCASALERAEKALHQTVNLTNQLLTFSKGGKPAKIVIDLRPVIENSAIFMLSGSRSTLRLNIPKDLWQVEADGGQIGQVIQNIVLNADQSMPIGGTVSITASNLANVDAALHSGLDKVDYVLITIQDLGVGIPDQYLSKIFDPYFTTKEKGSGLGLATSYSIIKNHGGMIDVRTKSGVGSTFMIYLPATARPIRPEPAETSHTVAPSRRLKILLMDDEEVIRNISCELLDALGHDVEVVEHGQAALDKYQSAIAAGRPFDIVILDLTIRGGMGGVETIQKLLKINPKIKAIVSSGYSDDETTTNYFSQGFKASLKKPYEVDALRDVINTMLDS
jgi:PAS domain S-box-containing protein